MGRVTNVAKEKILILPLGGLQSLERLLLILITVTVLSRKFLKCYMQTCVFTCTH